MRKIKIEMLINSDDDTTIADVVSAALRPLLSKYCQPENDSLILDWQYPEDYIGPMPTDGNEFSEWFCEQEEPSNV